MAIVSPLDIPYPLLKESLSPPITPGLTSLSGDMWGDLLGDGELGDMDDEESDDSVGTLAKVLSLLIEIGEKEPELLDIVIETASSVRDTFRSRAEMGLDEGLLSMPTPVNEEPSMMEEPPQDIGAGALGLSMMSPPPLNF